MALQNTWGDFNKRTKYERSVSYSAEPVRYSSATLEPRTLCWKAKRRSVTRFEYIGMSKTAADACKSDMIAKYTRSYMRWEARLIENQGDYPDVAIDQSHVVECGAGIEEKNVAGDNYSVELSVDETDEIIVREEPKTKEDFESIFQEAELRDKQDSGLDGLAIISAQWSRVKGKITSQFLYKITNFDHTLLDVQVKDGSGWVAATGVEVDGNVVSFTAGTNKTFRLNYNDGAYLSKAYTTTDDPNYRLIVESASFYPTTFQMTSTWMNDGTPHYDGGGIAQVSGILSSEITIPEYAGSYKAHVTIGSKTISVYLKSIYFYELDQVSGRSRFRFVTNGINVPSGEQPFTGVSVVIEPLNVTKLAPSIAFTVNQRDFVNIVSISATSSFNVTAVFDTSVLLANLSPTVRCMRFGREQARFDDVAVSYQSQGNGRFSASFQAPAEYDDATKIASLCCIHGTNENGDEVSSVWRRPTIATEAS